MSECDQGFDVLFSCYDGAEVFESVGIVILNRLRNIVDKNSNDDIGLFDKLSRPQREQGKKKIIKIFKKCELSITLTSNILSRDFFNITLNFKTESYRPFRNPKNNPRYIDINLNQLAQILKQLPNPIRK